MRTPTPRLLGRRSALRRIAVLPAAAASLAITGCASRQKVVAAEPPRPIALLAILPAFNAPGERNEGFTGNRPAGPVPVQTMGRGSGSSINPAAALGVGLLAMVIVAGVAESKKQQRDALQEAVVQVNFDAAVALDQHLAAALDKRDVRVVRITDPALAAELRAGRFERLPAGVDAWLDLEVTESGFYASTWAGGFSPLIQFNATVRAPVATNTEPDEYGYYADWRDGGADKRWLTTPKAMTFETLDKLKDRAAEARAGLDTIVQRLAALIADDLQRRTRGLARID